MRSSRQVWYLSAATAPARIAATATTLVAASVDKPLRPCPIVQPMAVTAILAGAVAALKYQTWRLERMA